jgi:hypothetical protein
VRRSATCVSILLGAAALLFTSVGVASADKETSQPPSNITDSEETYYLNTVEGRVSAPVRPQDVWAACGVNDPEHKHVRQFPLGHGAPDGGPPVSTSTLYCGQARWGYRHIQDGHMVDWENIAWQVGWNWRDMADFAMENGLDYPQRVDLRTDTVNDNYLYQGSFWIEDSDGNVIRNTVHKLSSRKRPVESLQHIQNQATFLLVNVQNRAGRK